MRLHIFGAAFLITSICHISPLCAVGINDTQSYAVGPGLAIQPDLTSYGVLTDPGNPNNDNYVQIPAWGFGLNPNSWGYTIRFGNGGIIDLVVAVTVDTAHPGASEYDFNNFIEVASSYTQQWHQFAVQLGFGTGDSFQAAASNVGLDFDWPDQDLAPDLDGYMLSQWNPTSLLFTTTNPTPVVWLNFAVDIPDVSDQIPAAYVTPGVGYTFTIRHIPDVPEPASGVLALLGSIFLIHRQHRKSA